MGVTNLQRKEGLSVITKAGSVPLDVKAISEDGEFEGYASTFGNVDRGMDMVMPGAFTSSIRSKPLSAIKCLRDHDTRKIVGKWLDVTEDNRGLKVKGRLFAADGDHVELAKETLTLMREGAIAAMSIGYQTIKAAWDEQTGVRKLLELDLWEISLVPFPMNEMATVDAVKNDLTITDVERILREGGAPGQFAKMVAVHGFHEATKRLGSRREGGPSLAELLRDAATKMKG